MSSPPSSPDTRRVDLWLARDPQLRDPALRDRLANVLPAEERTRVAGMQFESGRHQQLVTRAMARHVLSNYLPDVSPERWRFERGEHGRPAVARDMPEAVRAPNFNIAHTEGLVVMAVGRVELLGVDAERIDPRVRLPVARRYFSGAEADALDALPEEQRARRFQRLWTLKEAYLKALGTGIVGGLGTGVFHFEGGALRFESTGAAAGRWAFREYEIDGAFLVALACGADDASLEVDLRDYLP